MSSSLNLSDHRPKLEDLQGRLFLRNTLSLGAVAMLSGCNLQDGDTVDKVLWAMSRWNDRARSWLFSQYKLAPVYTGADVTRPFPFNAIYPEDMVPEIDEMEYRLEVSGLVTNKRLWSLSDLRQLPQASQITRHVCIEGWSAIGQWSGIPFRTFLERIGADFTARYVSFKCADRYYSSLDMATALHPQTILALDFVMDPLPPRQGSNQAWIQESEAHRCHRRHERPTQVLPGRPRIQLVQRPVVLLAHIQADAPVNVSRSVAPLGSRLVAVVCVRKTAAGRIVQQSHAARCRGSECRETSRRWTP